MWAYLKYVDGLDINKKRVLRLMQRNDLLVKPDTRLKATRTPGRNKPRSDRPNQWWGIDMTKVMVQGFGLDVHYGGTGLVHQEDCGVLCWDAMPWKALAGSPR